MKTYVLVALLALLLAPAAWAGWGKCESGDEAGVGTGPGMHICYNFSSSDVTGSSRSFDKCDNVDVVYYNSGDTETLCIDVCTQVAAASCSELRTVCLTGADGDAHEAGIPGTMLRPRLEGGTPSSTPQARFTCH